MKLRKVKVLCGKCNKEMEIKLWGAYAWWIDPRDKNYEKVKDYPSPHRNASHPCQHCGHLWLSSHWIIIVSDIEDEVTLKFGD